MSLFSWRNNKEKEKITYKNKIYNVDKKFAALQQEVAKKQANLRTGANEITTRIHNLDKISTDIAKLINQRLQDIHTIEEQKSNLTGKDLNKFAQIKQQQIKNLQKNITILKTNQTKADNVIKSLKTRYKEIKDLDDKLSTLLKSKQLDVEKFKARQSLKIKENNRSKQAKRNRLSY